MEDLRTDQFLIKNTPFIDIIISDLCKWFALTLESMCPTLTHTQNHNINSTVKSKLLSQKQTRSDQTNKLDDRNNSQHLPLRVKIPLAQSTSMNPISSSFSTSISSAVAASQSSINALKNKSKNILQISEIDRTKDKTKENEGIKKVISKDKDNSKEKVAEEEKEKEMEKNSTFRSFALSRVPQYLSSKNIPNIQNIPRQFSSNSMPFSASLNSSSPRTSPSSTSSKQSKPLKTTPLPSSLPLPLSQSSSGSLNSCKPFTSPTAPSSSSSSSSSSFLVSPSNPNTKTSPLGNLLSCLFIYLSVYLFILRIYPCYSNSSNFVLFIESLIVIDDLAELAILCLSFYFKHFFFTLLENFISALRFCDIIVESCNRNPLTSGLEKKKEKKYTTCYDTKNEKIKFEENMIFNALLNAFSEWFLKSHVRTSLLSSGEQQSMASFTLSRILLSELRKSTGNGVLLQMTASYMCGGNSYRSRENDASTTVCTDAHNGSNSIDKDISLPVYDIIASIISRAKSKNRDLAVASTLLLSSVIRSSDLNTAATLCIKREGDGFPSNSAVNSVQNTPKITVSVDNTPIIIDRENPLGIYRKIGSHVVTDVRDFYRNLLIESINQENDFNDTENGKENKTENSNNNVKEINDNNNNEKSNDNNDITKWEKVEFENLESRLTRICEEIFSSDKKFSMTLEISNVNNSKIEKKDNRDINESAEYDSVFAFKYTDVSACSITARLSSRLSSWLHFENVNNNSKSHDDNALDPGQNVNIESIEQKIRISTKITDSKDDKNINENGSESDIITNHSHSVLFDFILYRLAVFPDLRYEEQVALSGIIRDTLCVLCSTLVDRSLNYNCAYDKKTEAVEKLKMNVKTINLTNNNEKNEFKTSNQIYHNDDILIFILNIIEITSSLRKDMKTHLKSVALHGLKIKLLHDMLSTSSSSTSLPQSDIKQSVPNDKKFDKNINSNFQNNGSKRRDNVASQITLQKENDKKKLIDGQNDDIVILNDENCKLVSDETKQNKRILETTVILNELLRETQGMVFATNKLKFSLLTALNYSKSVIVLDENMKMDANNNEKSEFESDDETEMDQNSELKDIVNDKNRNSDRKEISSDDDFDMVKDESLNGKKPQTVKIEINESVDILLDFHGKDSKIPNEITQTLTPIAGKVNGVDRNEKCESDFLNDYEILEKELLNINC